MDLSGKRMHGFLHPFQEAILKLSGVVDYEQLRSVIKEAVQLALPNVVSTAYYFLIHFYIVS